MYVVLTISIVGNVVLAYLFIRSRATHNRCKAISDLRVSDEDIAVIKTLEKGRIKAFVTIKFNNSLVLKDIRIISDDEDQKNLKIEMPSRATKKGHLMEVYQFIDTDLRKKLYDMVLDKYKKL